MCLGSYAQGSVLFLLFLIRKAMSGCPVKRFKLPDYFNRLFHEDEKPGSLHEPGAVADKPILLDPTSVVSMATSPQDDLLFLASPDLSSVASVTSIHRPLTPESQVDALSIIHPPSKQLQVQGQPTVTQSNKANSQALVSTEILELQSEFLLKPSEETLVSSPSEFNFSNHTEALAKKGNPPCALVSGEGAEGRVRLCGVAKECCPPSRLGSSCQEVMAPPHSLR